jgi:uncharacterized membrane protein YfcA
MFLRERKGRISRLGKLLFPLKETNVTFQLDQYNHLCPMLEVIGYVSALLIGISLGLIGGGGSILTVPVLVYLLSISPVMATAYSLFIVGASSLVGGVRYAMKGLVDFKTALFFGIPSIIAVYTTRRFIVPAISDEIVSVGEWVMTKDMMLMVLFSVLMLVASVGMIRKKKESKTTEQKNRAGWITNLVVLGEGFVVGTLTGLVGAGGGFLIIPALVLIAGLDMKMAVGTSLIIIATKSLIGFLGDISNYTIDWGFLMIFSALAIIGIFLGSFLASKIDGKRLKSGFGWFVLVMGAFILLKELL